MKHEINKYYKEITFSENRARTRFLTEFRELVEMYFNNSMLNLITGEYAEEPKATDARASINLIIKKAYEMIRLADVKTYSASNSVLSSARKGKSIDIILNIFNLGRNEIPHEIALEYIDRAIHVYRSNRLSAFFRTINPFFWVSVLIELIVGSLRKKDEIAD